MTTCLGARSTSDFVARPRRFIQYNDLVFSGTEAINSSPSETITTKYETTEYMFRNGSYWKITGDQVLLKDDKITLDISIRTTDWDMVNIQAHQDFIKDNLLTVGKLWAIDTGGQLIWCNAILDSYTPTYEWTMRDNGYLSFQVAFTNPDAVWHKADGYTTFLLPYADCNFVNMIASCFQNATCQAFCQTSRTLNGTCEDCAKDCCELSKAISLCEVQGDMWLSFYQKCNSDYRIIHNCELGRERFGNERLWGESHCDACVDGAWSTKFYSDTVVESRDVTITLQGKFKDPRIMINDTMVKLKGTYDQGYLSISSTGLVQSFSCPTDALCGEAEVVSNENLTLCDNVWWHIKRGYNIISVDGVTSESFCVFIDYERLTI